MNISGKSQYISVICTSIVLALIYVLIFTQPVFAAIIASYDEVTGTLTINGDNENDSITVWCSEGMVYISGYDPSTGPLNCGSVEKIVVNGGGGNDTISLSGVSRSYFTGLSDGGVEIYGGGGDDIMVGSEFYDQMEGGEGNDTYVGQERRGTNPRLSRMASSTAAVFADTGGSDTLDFSTTAYGITIDLNLQNVNQVIDTVTTTLQLQGQFENFIGSPYNDTVSLDPLFESRTIDGGAGNDTLNIDTLGLAAIDDGSTITITSYAPINYSGFETKIMVSWKCYLPLIIR